MASTKKKPLDEELVAVSPEPAAAPPVEPPPHVALDVFEVAAEPKAPEPPPAPAPVVVEKTTRKYVVWSLGELHYDRVRYLPGSVVELPISVGDKLACLSPLPD